MIIFISDIDTAIFYVHLFETISAVCSFVKVLIYMNKSLNGRSLVKKLRPCLHGVGDRGLVG